MTTYEVQARRDQGYWSVRVPAVQRTTQARSYGEIESMARDLIALMLDVPAESFDLDVQVDLPDSVASHLAEAQRARKESEQARTRATDETRAAAKLLRDSGMTVRELGKVLGVSPQRAHQLTR